MKVIIDRFEGDVAVCEKTDRTMVNIPRSKIPESAKEGDVLIVNRDNIRIEPEVTSQRKARIDQLLKKLKRER